MIRPKRTTIDPSAFEKGKIAAQTGQRDDDGEGSRPLGEVLRALVDDLKEPDRSAVQLVTMQGMSLYEAAEIMESDLGYLADSKSIWRWARRGEKTLRTKMQKAGLYKEDD